MGILARRWIVGQECPTYVFRSDEAPVCRYVPQFVSQFVSAVGFRVGRRGRVDECRCFVAPEDLVARFTPQMF